MVVTQQNQSGFLTSDNYDGTSAEGPSATADQDVPAFGSTEEIPVGDIPYTVTVRTPVATEDTLMKIDVETENVQLIVVTAANNTFEVPFVLLNQLMTSIPSK